MRSVRLGRTGIVAQNGFGALPIQRISSDDSTSILKRAYHNGFNFFDTARFYTDSEEKIGNALSDVRDQIFISSKTMSGNVREFWEQLSQTLSLLKTDYLDIYQFHNPSICPKINDGTGLYEAMQEAKDKGMINHIGITNHKISLAREAVESALYETIQFPFSYLATAQEIDLVRSCDKSDIGFIAMKPLSGGLISNSRAAYAYIAQYENVLPIWGIQKQDELNDFISYSSNPPILDENLLGVIDHDRKILSGGFCRGCGYCLPCPADIDIPNCARMSLLLRRAPTEIYLNEFWQANMARIDDCTECNQCLDKCPYGLDTPALLKDNWKDYQQVTEKTRA